MVDRLFVYGTLRAGEAAHAVVAPYVISAVRATALGTMYALPAGYPGVVADDRGVVHGELLTLHDLAAALPALDAYEGDDFTRILAEITTAAGRGWAWMYVLLSSELAHGAPVIADGDWAGYRPRRG
ncbi:MAG: gamma-glutamylcyclotransferase [Myxococcales bacterium]|nr:gamma-glutamylcyclotransferase [Myxococcales bacterium]